MRRQAESKKRQKLIDTFFSRSQPGGQARAPPDQLGQGYTDRNITSKTFAHHVTTIENRIIELSNGDALKLLQLAAAVNQCPMDARDSSFARPGPRSMGMRTKLAESFLRNVSGSLSWTIS